MGLVKIFGEDLDAVSNMIPVTIWQGHDPTVSPVGDMQYATWIKGHKSRVIETLRENARFKASWKVDLGGSTRSD